MRRIWHQRLQLQLGFALLAAISVAMLAVELTENAMRHAERFVLSDASKTLTNAVGELQREYRLRVAGDSTWAALPASAQDVTLRGISQTVLGAYPGVEGGFWVGGQFSGYAFPTHDGGAPKVDVPAAEREVIEQALAQARTAKRGEQVLRGAHDFVVVVAAVSGGTAGPGVWAMKRLPGQAERAEQVRSWWLAALVGAALLGAAGVLATGIGLRRGVAQIQRELASSQTQLPERRDELGAISAAINEMTRARQRLEAEVQREDRLRMTGRLVGQIAHEIRNPLNGIRLALQVLAHRRASQALTPDDFATVIGEVDRMNRLLSDLLSFQQPRPAVSERIDVRSALAAVVRPLQADGREVEIVVSVPEGLAALADVAYLQQIATNLLLNALDVSARGSVITVNATERDGLVEIAVIDEGPGLTPEQREHLFEPFYTTKATGHGLGLAVSRELARSMGGELVCCAASGRGAEFRLRLLKGVVQVGESDYSHRGG